MKKGILVVGGIVAVGGLAYYLYNKNKNAAATPQGSGTDFSNMQQSNVQASLPAGSPVNSSGIAPVEQTLWKDPDGHTFELLKSSEDKYGYLLKVDGGGNSKAVTVSQGPDGYITIKNKVNETWKFKNGWQRLSGLSGLGGRIGIPAYLMN
jgi:hypothetical protein